MVQSYNTSNFLLSQFWQLSTKLLLILVRHDVTWLLYLWSYFQMLLISIYIIRYHTTRDENMIWICGASIWHKWTNATQHYRIYSGYKRSSLKLPGSLGSTDLTCTSTNSKYILPYLNIARCSIPYKDTTEQLSIMYTPPHTCMYMIHNMYGLTIYAIIIIIIIIIRFPFSIKDCDIEGPSWTAARPWRTQDWV